MGTGISLMASQISLRVAPKPCFCDWMRVSCSGVSGNSGTRQIDQKIVVTEMSAPNMKDQKMNCGMWLPPTASLLMPSQTSSAGDR